MKVLLIKSSSMGDIIHTFPAVTDALTKITNISIDWVVEESFAEIPLWHTSITKVIPVALRRWRKSIIKSYTQGELSAFIKQIRKQDYDVIIDAQGLIKSAIMSTLAKGSSFGYSYQSAREKLASLFYNNTYKINWNMHAVERIRHLFANSLAYKYPNHRGDFSLNKNKFNYIKQEVRQPYVILFHGTTWKTKHWPENYWCKLVALIDKININIYLPQSNITEKIRAIKMTGYSTKAKVLESMSLTKLAAILYGAKAAVAVDTGFGHLSAALNIPCVSLYNVTDPKKIGTYGSNQIHLASDNYTSDIIYSDNVKKFTALQPNIVFDNLQQLLNL